MCVVVVGGVVGLWVGWGGVGVCGWVGGVGGGGGGVGCARECRCVCACMYICVCVCVRVSVCLCVSVCSSQPISADWVPYWLRRDNMLSGGPLSNPLADRHTRFQNTHSLTRTQTHGRTPPYAGIDACSDPGSFLTVSGSLSCHFKAPVSYPVPSRCHPC